MATIVACWTVAGVPLEAPAAAMTIRIRRADTGALVVTDSAMTELGDGCFAFDFSPVDGLDYSIRADGDPAAAGQTSAAERYQFGALSGATEARVTEIGTLLDYQANRLEVDFAGVPRLVTLYERDGTTVKSTQTLETEGGEAVATQAGIQTKRGAAT